MQLWWVIDNLEASPNAGNFSAKAHFLPCGQKQRFLKLAIAWVELLAVELLDMDAC